MEQVQTPEVAAFGELNKRMSVLISNTVQQKFGTPEERKFMTALTDAGLESAEEMIVLINEGLTYEIWKEFLDRKNNLDGPLGLFENEAGDMAAIVEEFRAGDYRAVYEQFKTEGVFTVETVEKDIQMLKSRKEWAEQMWGREDEHAKAAEVLAQVAKESVDAPGADQ